MRFNNDLLKSGMSKFIRSPLEVKLMDYSTLV